MTPNELDRVLEDYKIFKMELNAFEKEQDYKRSQMDTKELEINGQLEKAVQQIAKSKGINGAIQIETDEYVIAVNREKMCPQVVVVPRSNIVKLT